MSTIICAAIVKRRALELSREKRNGRFTRVSGRLALWLDARARNDVAELVNGAAVPAVDLNGSPRLLRASALNKFIRLTGRAAGRRPKIAAVAAVVEHRARARLDYTVHSHPSVGVTLFPTG